MPEDKAKATVKNGDYEGLDMDPTEVILRVKKPEDLLSGEWLQQMSDQELVLTVMSLVLELQSRAGKASDGDGTPGTGTDALKVAPHPFAMDADELREATDNFLRMPEGSSKKDREKFTWRVILISANPKHKPLGLELRDEVVVGRGAEGDAAPDLDLRNYDAPVLGISRRHAVLRPTPEELLLLDLDSTNGTYHNRTRIEPGKAQVLHDEDTISFAELHFKVMFVKRPGK